MKGSFASDNCAGAHPKVVEAIARAARGDVPSYGYDHYTEQLEERVKELFGDRAESFAVFNGTGANVLCLDALTNPYDAVVCADCAHVNVDECGAPEKIAGVKLLAADAPAGKLTVESVRLAARDGADRGNEHRAQPTVLSLTQATELGTVYREDELLALRECARSLGLAVHVDGARLANALATTGMSPARFVEVSGVDALAFGGTKNGLAFGELVIFFHAEAAARARFLRKQNLQLASKMRFLSAQFLALLDGDLWLENAARANEVARRLASGLDELRGVEIRYPVEANAVFARLPRPAIEMLLADWHFYVWDEAEGIVRLMASFDTTESQVDEFVRDAARAVSSVPRA